MHPVVENRIKQELKRNRWAGTSRAISETAAAKAPPELSPPTATRCASTPKRSACCTANQRGIAVFGCRRKGMFGCQPVIDGNDYATTSAAIIRALVWALSRSPSSESAAVVVDEARSDFFVGAAYNWDGSAGAASSGPGIIVSRNVTRSS